MWMVIEIAKDPALLQEIRDEVVTALIIDPKTGASTIDTDKLVTLPLLQSVFTEVLRMHMNFNVIRHAKEPIDIEGVVIPKGSMIQAPMVVPHYDENVWGATGHPASEFWAGRHLKHTEVKDESGNVSHKVEYAMAGRPTSFFPFGA
jgi:cytochrome P450